MTEQSLKAALAEMEELFTGLGWGRQIGFGQRPVILVVDAIRAFTDPAYPQALSVDTEVDAIARLLDVARSVPVPIVFVTTGYQDPRAELGSWLDKSPGLGDLQVGSAALEPDPRLGRQTHERLLLKKGTSAFFGTSLADWLRARGIDTCIITGFTANGCAMGTTLDSTQHGFRTAIVQECVASRLALLKQVSLCNLRTWADIVSLDQAMAYLRNLA
jgi:maleamate amidohydrolase